MKNGISQFRIQRTFLCFSRECIIQFISVIVASLTFLMLLSYSRIIEEKGDATYYALNNRLSSYFKTTNVDVSNKHTILNELNKLFSGFYTIWKVI